MDSAWSWIGKQAHPDDQRWQDLRRINEITEKGLGTLRYGWLER